MLFRFKFPKKKIIWGQRISHSKILWESQTEADILHGNYQAVEIQRSNKDGSLYTKIDESFGKDGMFCPAEKKDVKILAPIPSELCPCIWCVGLNYRKHAHEVRLDKPKFPVLFMKNPYGSITGPFDPIIKPSVVDLDEMDMEAELAIIIGKECKNVTSGEALNYVFGFTAANDVSARRWQGKKSGGQWCRSKSYDSFLPIGPCIVYPKNLPENGMNLNISSSLILSKNRGGESIVMQNSNTKDMIFSISELISFISQGTSLPPWTIILTGTPEGVGIGREPPLFMQPNDQSIVTIEHIGSLSNKIIE